MSKTHLWLSTAVMVTAAEGLFVGTNWHAAQAHAGSVYSWLACRTPAYVDDLETRNRRYGIETPPDLQASYKPANFNPACPDDAARWSEY